MSAMAEPTPDPAAAFFAQDEDEEEEEDDTESETNDDDTDPDAEQRLAVAGAETLIGAEGDLLPFPIQNSNVSIPSFENGGGAGGGFEAPVVPAPASVPVSSDESRRLFQRLWSDEEELMILRKFLEFTSRRGTTFASHQYDTGPFYEEIKKQFNFDFSKNQLIEKLRRLKKKYRVCALRMQTAKDFSFKTAHEQGIYEVARHIWRPELKRERESDEEDGDLNPNPNPNLNPNPNPSPSPNYILDHTVGVTEDPVRSKKRVRRRPVEGSESVPAQIARDEPAVPVAVKLETSIPESSPVVEVQETVKNYLSPLFKELISTCMNNGSGSVSTGGFLGFGSELGLGLFNPDGSVQVARGEKWRQQQILELEVYLKRIELLQDHVKSTLEELKSTSG